MADGEGDLPSALAIWLDKGQENKFNFSHICGATLECTKFSLQSVAVHVCRKKKINFNLKPSFELKSNLN